MIADVGSVRITEHAIERYARRRGHDDRERIEAKFRQLLARCQHDNPPLRLSAQHGPGRIYRVGQLSFVMNADSNTVITVLIGGQSGARSGQERNRRYRKARRARREESRR